MTMSKLYTCILDFKGGTYITQVNVPAIDQALSAWVETVDTTKIEGLTTSMKKQLMSEIAVEKPSMIEGVKNVWCTTFLLEENLALVNLIETVA
jgi:hypothetical protein